VIHQVGAHRIVTIAQEGHLQLRADAICARDQHRLTEPIAIELEEAAE
jgi:hypothetical protein